MHKTLYIDVDEEITSIVDRVRKAQVEEVIVVVPKGALLIQSLVNLKLLKKEASRRKIKLIIVTQDKVGKKLIEKAGILVEGRMDGSMVEEEIFEKESQKSGLGVTQEFSEGNKAEESVIGSKDYFDESLPVSLGKEKVDKIGLESKKEDYCISESGLHPVTQPDGQFKAENGKEKKKGKAKIADIVTGSRARKGRKPKIAKPVVAQSKEISLSSSHFLLRETKRQKGLEAEKFFQSSNFKFFPHKEEKVLRTMRVKGKMRRYFTIFLISFFVLGGTAAAYFFLPRAVVVLHMKKQEKSVSMSVEARTGTSEIDGERGVVPAALLEVTKEKSGEFEATGSKSGAGKATGKVVIYNKFSSENQPLVATTRLETSDGKIFRITKNVVVPGMSKAGEETKPGAIEVEVVADKPGEEYNIEPTTFKIVGFKGGPKYEKFYAKSAEAMVGGAKGETAIVTSQDVAQAKEKLVTEAEREAKEELKKSLREGRFFFEDTVSANLLSSSSSVNIGSQAEKFTYDVSVKVQALSFAEEDIKELIRRKETDSFGTGVLQADFNRNLNYILSDLDIEKGLMRFEVRTDANIAGGVDLENFKKGILGKNSQELADLVKNYPAIKDVEVAFWPFFVSRIPINEGRVEIKID